MIIVFRIIFLLCALMVCLYLVKLIIQLSKRKRQEITGWVNKAKPGYILSTANGVIMLIFSFYWGLII